MQGAGAQRLPVRVNRENERQDFLAAGQGCLEQTFSQIVSAQTEVSGHFHEHCREGSHPQRRVGGDRDVVLAPLSRGQPDMRSSLAGDRVTEPLESAGKVYPGDVTRQPQTAMTSSRTKCSRTIFGACPSS